MPHAEFDAYLSLLSKFLRLSDRQRGELSDELTDHLEARVEVLQARGVPREPAVRLALEEFGDAALLADRFSRLPSRRRRRILMRCTAASAVVVAAVVWLSLSLAPPGPAGPGPRPLAADPGDAASPAAVAPETPLDLLAAAETERKLDSPLGTMNFEGQPLHLVMDEIAKAIEADILFDRASIDQFKIDLEQPIEFHISRTRVSARTALEFLLDPLNLTLVNRSGVLFVTQDDIANEMLVTKVYNVRDLMDSTVSHYDLFPLPLSVGQIGNDAARSSVKADVPAAQPANGSPPVALDFVKPPADGQQAMYRPIGPATSLYFAVTMATAGPWFDIDGAGGTTSVFDGLMIVRQTRSVHTQVADLLAGIRAAKKLPAGQAVSVP